MSRPTPCMVRQPAATQDDDDDDDEDRIASDECSSASCVPVSAGPMPQQYPHPSATLHPHPQHPQPSATPTGQAQQGGPPQHGGPPNHPAASPVQHPQHQQAAAGDFSASEPSLLNVSGPALHQCSCAFVCGSGSGGSPGPPHGQPAPTAADVLRFGRHAPLNDARPEPAVPSGVVLLCPAGCLHPPSAGAARLQPQPHRSRAAGTSARLQGCSSQPLCVEDAGVQQRRVSWRSERPLSNSFMSLCSFSSAGPHAVRDGAVTPPGAHPPSHDAHGHPRSSRGSAGTHGPDRPEPNPCFFHHTFLLPGTSTR